MKKTINREFSPTRRESLDMIKMVDNMRNGIFMLERSFGVCRHLEAEQRSRFWVVKKQNMKLNKDLEDAQHRNTTMLNLFRLNATDELPQSLKNEVKQAWQQKYDALLQLNNQLRKDIYVKNVTLEEKNKQIVLLQEKLLSIGEKLIQRDITMKSMCDKYLALKKRKNEQEMLLRGSIETLQDALLKTNTNVTSKISRMSLMPSKEALLAYETRRSDRLARENSFLRALLQESRINSQHNNHHQSSETGSCQSLVNDYC